MHRFSNTLLALLLATAALLGALPATAQSLSWPTKAWATSSPEEQGMSSEALGRLVDFGAANAMDSLLVTRHGKIVLDATYAPFQAGLKHRMYSSTKSVISTLIAMALRDGKLDSVDRKILDFFPDLTIANLDDAKKAITIRHLLDMTSGLEWVEGLSGPPESYIAMARSPNWVQFILDRPMAAAPGSVFYYDSGNSHLLSAILTKVTGLSARDYAQQMLFGPLGIEDVLWRHDPQGISTGGEGLYLQPRDMAKIGYLYLRNGQWGGQREGQGEGRREGKQILPQSWIEGVAKSDIDMRESWASRLRYGSQFWVIPGKDAYMAVGYHRQLIVVMPRLDIVVVATGSSRFAAGGGQPMTPRYGFETLVGNIEAAVKAETPLPADPLAMASLAERLRDAAREKPVPAGGPSELAKTVSDRTYRFDGNRLNIKSLTLKFDDPQPSYEYEIDGGQSFVPAGRYGGPIGFDGNYRIGGRMPFGPSAARGAWLADGKSLVIDVQTLGNDDAVRVTHVFDGKTVDLEFEWAGGSSKLKLQGRADN